MSEFLDQNWVSIVGGAIIVVVAWMVFKSVLGAGEAKKTAISVTAFCLHCAWEGRVPRTAMRCARCRSTNMSVTAT